MTIKKTVDKDRAITLKGDGESGELILVKGKAQAYVWAGTRGGAVATFSGVKSLRAFAKAILNEVRAPRAAIRLRSEGKRK